MIVTVTLNAALDRTVRVPNFQLGAPPPRRRVAAPAGRQGRQRGARAEEARPAGHRHRPGRRAHRHAHHRGADRRGDPQRLRPDRGRVAHEHRGHRPDQQPADRDQRVRARRCSRPSSTCSSTRSATCRRAPTSSCSPGRCPRDVPVRLLRDPAARAAPGEDGHRGRRLRARRCGRRSPPSRASSARTCARPRRSSATSSATRRTWPPPSRRSRRWAPRRPSSTTRTAASPTSAPRAKRGRTYRARLPRRDGRGLDGRLRATPSSPATCRRATATSPPRRPCPGGGVRRREHPALRRRRLRPVATSSRSMRRVEVARPLAGRRPSSGVRRWGRLTGVAEGAEWRSEWGGAREDGGRTASTESRSCRVGARAQPRGRQPLVAGSTGPSSRH